MDWKQKRQRSKWQNQEKGVAESLQGRTQIGSGNKPFYPGDVLSEKFLVSCKRTDKASISLKLKDIQEIAADALQTNKIPVMHIEIGNKKYWLIQDQDVIVSPEGGTLIVGVEE